MLLQERIPKPRSSQRQNLNASDHSSKYSPIPRNLHLSSVRPKELHIRVLMVEKRDHQPPRLRPPLHFQQLLLQSALVIGRLTGGVGLLY